MTEKTTISGFLNIDKPAGLTSHDVVAHVRRLLTTHYKLRTKVGHTGTLDPFATGVLLVVIGPATRLIQFTHAWDKEYEATFVFGATSDTDDSTGAITPAPTITMNDQDIRQALPEFTGSIKQIPPDYSAVKVKGVPLYKHARRRAQANGDEDRGESIAIPSRTVTIHDIELISFAYPEVKVRIRCSTGTYIRALARDLGKQLGTGAYVSSLRRTRIGKFDILKSVSPGELSTGIPQVLQPPHFLVSHLPRLTLTSHNIQALRQGKQIPWSDPLPAAQPLALFDEHDILIGIGLYDLTTRLLSPRINVTNA